MHELSIVRSIVSIAEKEVVKANAVLVEEIELEIGYLATVEIDALNFAWEYGVKETLLEGSLMHIHTIEGKARCNKCGEEFPVRELFDPCPNCTGHSILILNGQELRIRSMVVS
jgi:hydrogenase nickel incorporation protein HypA/HybF